MSKDAHYVSGFLTVDPFDRGARQSIFSRAMNAFMATALFQCWYYILFFAVESTVLTILYENKIWNCAIKSTLLTVLGTVLGFVISYRTSSSFERYNEGRRYWSTIVFNARTMARAIWFHVPDIATNIGASDEEKRARTLVEKKTVLNLTEAFAVAVKHYLRGEEGIRYEDLYHLTKYLPAYSLPAGRPDPYHAGPTVHDDDSSSSNLPLPATSPKSQRFRSGGRGPKGSVGPDGGPALLPSRNPPRFSIFDLFPFTLLVKPMLKRGMKPGGKYAQKARAKLGYGGRGEEGEIISHNIPLEITLYLSAYIAALQQRKQCDVPTINLLLNSLNALSDSLTGLERILTTPIPFSFSVHLWTVTLLYCAALPFQLLETMHWLTIPATIIASFIFTGFVAAGEEIEDPFGFDRNDLNLDHFTHNIIRAELASITSVPVPDPAVWAFQDENDAVFANDGKPAIRSPETWVKHGIGSIRTQLGRATSEQEVQKSDEKNKTKKKHAVTTENANHEAPTGNAGLGGAAGAAGGAAGDAASPTE
ncbi:hypothetical protein FRC14_001576 [Serendipita sp. 396]|nr:hypothetical protein FRC14_001576 [Serendipita sp. 396]KAG8785190.1 hypothetical protein FRC15_001847 [Serendipita sp. 397]KAG8800800.1 hypothetical protein FRC16_002080 [Serendipita sp. 398]KAG8824286.1 hypothetical protein FRC19_002118 [Serendipita sp. 401]KAG8835644.1 hypothetical protein FRC18_000193 [Serendipita sp. 400]KAG8857874.1 hypothetical protein FRB91_010716 [Serendipita sp. 411]KAG8869525.1 hypothetical protein FRC20_001273 [Serendipita sp. 405]KAG9055312.1 hypothetical prot